MTTNILTIAISILALAISTWALYLQRRDKKPRLILSIERTNAKAETGGSDARGFPKLELMGVILIHARNPTDRTITISKTLYEDEGEQRFDFPVEFYSYEVAPHKKQTGVVKLPVFHDWIETLKLAKAKRGRFVIIDDLDNEYKTSRLTDFLTELTPSAST
jgi:hypothetical protein